MAKKKNKKQAEKELTKQRLRELNKLANTLKKKNDPES